MLTSLRRILALIVKEFATVMKDPKSRFVVVGPPLIQFFVFGYAATFDLNNVDFAVLDESRTTHSRALVADFAASETFNLTHELTGEPQVASLIDARKVRMVLRIHPDFASDLEAGRPARLQIIVDGRNSNVASIALGYAGDIVGAYSSDRSAPSGAPVVVERAWHNPNFSSRWYIVSCLGGVIATVVVTLLTSLSVAREREFGTFDQLLVTPLTPPGLLIGKSVPPLVFGMADAAVLSLAAVYWYGVPFTGGLFAAGALLLVYMLSIVGVGLFISSLSATMQQGLLGSFIFIMPAVILSGFTTPIANMPGWLQAATWINPLRWVVEGLRKIFLEAAAITDIAYAIAPLAVIAAVTLTAAAWLFQHRSS